MTRTLLIVDDLRTNREILKNMLGGDYRILEAEHGREAIAVMADAHTSISAVLLDLGMPVMNGYELLSYMQGSEKLSQIPVIVMTGQTDAESEEKALSLGALDYVSKPYKSAIIKQRIRNTINLRETAATVNALRTDRLTGLYSREAFFDRVRELTSAQEPGYYTMSCVDIDKFKVVNDQYGQEKGDEVLRHFARTFREGFEPNGGVCCRVSGDDFAVLYPTGMQGSGQLSRIRKQAAAFEGLAAPVAFSVGRYLVSDQTMSPSGMYDRAVLAVDSIRGRYDVSVAVYEESMRDRLLHEQQIVTEMEGALLARQFEVWYQPQFNHTTGAMISAEALVRWRHPERGLVPPGTFVPVFEQNGFIYSLDKYVWEDVCRFLRAELDAGRSPLPVSVNVSRYDVFRPDFLDYITGLITRYRLPVQLVRLEITESAFAEDTNRIVAVVRQLVDFGFLLEIDDFGSGYSSLNTLKNVPAQVVKLDMRFLEGDGNTRRGGNILESIVRMTKWIGMSVIAEGVERKTQADFLKSIGCSYIQGYLYARPMPEDEYRTQCEAARKEDRLFALETVDNLDNESFWDPESMDTLIFNSYVGAACIFEFHRGRIELLRATDKYAQVIGSETMTVEDVLRLDWQKHLSAETLARVTADLERSAKTRCELTGEYVFLDLPNAPHETYLRSTMRVIASAGDRYLVYCTNENLTAQRKAEQRAHRTAEQLRAVMNNVACGLTATFNGKEADFLLSNGLYYSLLGYTREQYQAEVGSHAFRSILPEDHDGVIGAVQRVLEDDGPLTIEYRATRRDGGIIWLRSILSVAQFEGVEGQVLLSTYTDITEQKTAERALKDTTAQLRLMMDDIPGGFARIRVDAEGHMTPVYVNEGLCRLAGMTREETMALFENDVLGGIHPDDVDAVRDAFARMQRDGEAHSMRYRLRRGEDGYVWLMIFGRSTRNDAGDVYLNIYYSDASAQAREEERQKELLDNLPCGAALYDFDGETLSAVHLNKRYWELVSRTQQESTDITVMTAVLAEDRAVIDREVRSAIAEKRDIACDIRVKYGADAYRPFHITGRVLQKTDGRYAIYTAYTPLTSDEMSVQELLPIVLSAVMESQEEYLFVKDRNLRYVCCSRKVARLVHLASPADAVGRSDHELFEKAVADAFSADDRYVLDSGESLIDNIDRIPSTDGVDRYASTSKFPLKDSEGHIVGVYGIGRDVTETRNMRTRFELLTNSIPGGIATYEERGGQYRVLYYNDGFCRLFGMSRAEYDAHMGDNVFSGVFPEDLPALKKALDAFLKAGTQVDSVFRVRLRDGSYKWIDLKTSTSEREGDKTVFNAVLFDVTQRQESLEHMRISEEENRLAVQHSGGMVCRYNALTGALHVPENAQLALSLPEIVENVPEGPIERGEVAPETVEVYRALFEGIRDGQETGAATFRLASPRGWRWLEARYSTIFSDVGEPVSAVVSFKDITEQLEKDFAYKRWQQSFLDRAPTSYSLFRCGVRATTAFVARGGALLNVQFAPGPFNFDERTAGYAAQYVVEEDRDRFNAFLSIDALMSGFYQGKRIVTLEYREMTKDGDFRWLRLTVDLVEHAYSAEVEAYLLFEDIDRAKRLELATIEQAETDPLTGVMNRSTFEARVNNIIRTSKPNTQHALMLLDMDGFKQVNDAFGHGAGDQALIDIAASLRTALRHDDLVGRLGGDEFLIFLADIPGDIIAATKAKQVCALVRKSFSADVELSGSLGIAVTPRDGMDFEKLYERVDVALYHVKGNGKDNFAFYHEEMAEKKQFPAMNAPTPVPEPELKPKRKRRMLIVDDSRIDHAMLSGIFADDYIIDKAKDGNTALVRLRHYGSAISVVLLDLMMPGMDGFTVLKRMQSSVELRNVPVIVVSGDENSETSLRAIREGAVDYVTKPVDPEILRIRVQSAISKAENERLRAKNSFLEFQTGEVTRYKTALERSGIVVIENDWVAGTFIYDPFIGEYLLGTYDERSFWHILLSDFVAETRTVQRMQGLVQEIATDRRQTGKQMLVQLRTPAKTKHWFRLSVYKLINEFGLAGKIYLTFIDLGKERSAE